MTNCERQEPPPTDFVTVASFDTTPRAHLAVGMLSEAGIDAMLSNDFIVDNVWDIGSASGGVEVRVPRVDAKRAHAMVEQAAFHGGVVDVEVASEFDDKDDLTPAQRANTKLAHTALQTSAFGLFFPPLQVYSLWLLARLCTRLSRGRTTPRIRNRMLGAFVLNLLVIALVVIMVQV